MPEPSSDAGFGGADGQPPQRSSLGGRNGGAAGSGADCANKSKNVVVRGGEGKQPISLGLSRSAKHLLVCAYLASHNSRDTGRW